MRVDKMKVVILAGGFGTRLAEQTDVRPKPMVEIGGRPILWHIMKVYSHYGVNDFSICLGYKGYVIKEYFANYFLHMSDVNAEDEIRHCEVCGSGDLMSVLDLGLHPMCDDLVAIGNDRVCKEYPIEILYCDTCRTAHQRFQIPKQELFPQTYHYRSRHTADVLNGMQKLVQSCEQAFGSLSGKRILDVGCNDGSLLSIFREHGAETFGVEPTGAAQDAKAAGHEVIEGFFDEKVAADFVALHGRPDVVTFTNVFAHIEDLPAVLRALKALSGPQTAIVIENHYLGAILDGDQFDTFYHEHPRTYSYRSFTVIAGSLGMKVGMVEFPARYGGNIRVFLVPNDEGPLAHDRWDELESRESQFARRLALLPRRIAEWRETKGAKLAGAARRHGPLRGKAFPGRAAIPIKMLGLDGQTVAAVYEKPASGKIGHYVPGTRIPIVSDDEFEPGNRAPVVNMAWHIASEIGAYMRARGYDGELIDVIEPDDFGP